jgi:hypothetical protein
MDDSRARDTVLAAFRTFSGGEGPLDIQAARAPVSTNRVYRLVFDRRTNVFAKISSYGSFVHFRQDHQRIEQWRRLLGTTRYSHFLAPILTTGDDVYTFHAGDAWVAFYEEMPVRAALPRVLSDGQITTLASEMARFHRACAEVAPKLAPTWKTLGSDIAILFDALGNPAWLAERGLSKSEARYLRDHCNLFLRNADRLAYAELPKCPILLDWNIGNFSVTDSGDDFELFSRWDYDWFRIEPRVLDFYFLSRVSSGVGDKTQFSYFPSTFFEARFERFLRRYHAIFPLQANEISFMREAYRFFVLNYVARSGEHFFRDDLRVRLLREAVDYYLPELDRLDFDALLPALTVPEIHRKAEGQEG